jgi:hypothetical protein
MGGFILTVKRTRDRKALENNMRKLKKKLVSIHTIM